MTQFQALSMDSEEEDGRGAGLAEGGQFSVGGLTSGSEDELYEVDLRRWVWLVRWAGLVGYWCGLVNSID